jgi:DNA-binding HxlR family transcriptional regulator
MYNKIPASRRCDMEDFGVDSFDRSTLFDEDYPQDVREFFSETGGIELISCLRYGPKRFAELKKQIDYSPSVINDRLAEARGLQLVRIGQQSRGEAVYRVHALTPIGKPISDQMKEIGLSQTHQNLWTIRLEYEQQKEEFEDWVDESDGLESRIEEFIEMLDHGE